MGGEDNENIGEDDGNAESRAQDEKEKRALELMKYVQECKSKPKNWINKYPAKVQLLEPINRDSKSIKHTKNDIANNLTGKRPHEICNILQCTTFRNLQTNIASYWLPVSLSHE